MDLKVKEMSDSIIELALEKEDFSISDILHQELLKNSKVIFAGIAPPHPLLKRYMIKIQTVKNTKPINIVASSGEGAAKTALEILEAAKKALEVKGEAK